MNARRLAPLVMLAACTTPRPAVPFAGPVNTDQVTVNMTLRMTEAGMLKALLRADTAITPAGQSRSQLKHVRLEFQTAGGGKGTLTSKTGEYDPESDLMIARGGVVLVVPGENGQGTRTIRTEELNWNQSQDRVWSRLQTRVEEPTRTVITQSFTSDSRFTNIQGVGLTSENVKVGEGGMTF
jgi:LPS export ABC transporter protein LptC